MRVKRHIAITTLLLAMAAVTWLGIKALEITSAERDASQRRSILPKSTLFDLDGRPQPLRVDSTGAMVLTFFTTACEYCRLQIQGLVQTDLDLDGVNVVLVSPEDPESLAKYRRRAGLEAAPHVRTLWDREATLARALRIRAVPTSLLYDSSDSLRASFEGLTPVSRILKAVEVAR